MKQTISIEQFEELSEKAQDKLANWFADRENYPFMTIGQMIEFLDEYAKELENDFNIRIHSAGTGWERPGERLTDIDGLGLNEIEDEVELCDALWEAVKNILDKP